MGIYIKGMEMPKSCSDCPFCTFTADEKKCIGYCNTSDDDYYCKALDRFMEYDKVDGGVDILGKSEDCPLIEIPTPHGNLKDADALMKYELPATLFPKGREENIDVWTHAVAIGDVMGAETIIEAEE